MTPDKMKPYEELTKFDLQLQRLLDLYPVEDNAKDWLLLVDNLQTSLNCLRWVAQKELNIEYLR